MLRLILTLGLLAGADAGFGRKKEKDGASRMEEELNAEAEQNREAPVGNAREWEVENAARYKTGELNTAELGLKNMQQAMKDPSVMAETMKMMQDPEMLAAMSNPKASPPVPATAPHRAACGCASSLRTRLAKGRSRARGAGARRPAICGPASPGACGPRSSSRPRRRAR